MEQTEWRWPPSVLLAEDAATMTGLVLIRALDRIDRDQARATRRD